MGKGVEQKIWKLRTGMKKVLGTEDQVLEILQSIKRKRNNFLYDFQINQASKSTELL